MPITSLLENIFKLHSHNKNSGKALYYKYVVQILSHPSINLIEDSKRLINEILKNNYLYLNSSVIKTISEKVDLDLTPIMFLFENWGNNVNLSIQNCIRLIVLLKKKN